MSVSDGVGSTRNGYGCSQSLHDVAPVGTAGRDPIDAFHGDHGGGVGSDNGDSAHGPRPVAERAPDRGRSGAYGPRALTETSTNTPHDPVKPESKAVRWPGDPGTVTGSLTSKHIETIVPCFTPGTTIATPRGECPVEELRVGDRVVTRDNGIREIRWIGRRSLSYAELQARPHLRPVLIEKGALGNGLPERDMLVSPNHRMLVASDHTALFFEEREILVAAKHIASARGVRSVDVLGVTYIHFMCDRHEVVLANGVWAEAFQPRDLSLGALGNAQRTEFFELSITQPRRVETTTLGGSG